MLVTLAMGMCSLAPAETLVTVPVTLADRRSGMTMPLAPAASAVRRIAPRLCGSSTPSRTTTSEYSARLAAITSSRSLYCLAEVTATTPWCATLPAMRSSSERSKKRTWRPRRRDSSIRRCRRMSWRSLAIPIHSNVAPACLQRFGDGINAVDVVHEVQCTDFCRDVTCYVSDANHEIVGLHVQPSETLRATSLRMAACFNDVGRLGAVRVIFVG